MQEKYDSVIVGSGPAGLTAAIYNVRANMKTVVIAGNQPGGQLTTTTRVENWPGFENGVDGVPLMMSMQKQATNLGVEMKNGIVKQVSQVTSESGEKCFAIILENGEVLETKTVIIATGAAVRWLDIGEKEYIGKGVSACATCDGAFFKEKMVAVVGGGDSAVEEATFLTRFAKKVYVIHRRDSLRAKAKEQERLLSNPKVEMVWNTEVLKVSGVDKLTSVSVKNNKNGEEKKMEIDGLFVAIGGVPATSFVKELVETEETGHVVIGKHKDFPFMTSLPGIFAAGDCTDPHYKQAITSAGDGCKAALDSQKWLEEQE